MFNVKGLVANGDLGDTRQIDQSQVDHTIREDLETNGLRGDALILPCIALRLGHDFIANFLKVAKDFVSGVEKFAPLF